MFQDVEYGPCDVQLLVGADHARRNLAAVGANHLRVYLIARRVKFQPDAVEAVANARPERNGVFADAAREDERIEPAQRRGERADPFSGLIRKNRQRLGGARVALLARQQVAHIGAGFRNAEQAGLHIDHLVELGGGHAFGAGEVREQSGVKVARA